MCRAIGVQVQNLNSKRRVSYINCSNKMCFFIVGEKVLVHCLIIPNIYILTLKVFTHSANLLE
jgi:hypothetical protein